MVFIGRITKDASVTTLKDERKVVNFTIAINDRYKKKGTDTWEQIATYVNCAYWISTEVAKRLTKGSLVELTGRLYVNAYTDMKGDAKGSLNCHVNSITVHHQVKTTAAPVKTEEPAEDLPF